ncbi:MAG: TonB family protein [Akkermansiaceae bacterium]
MSRHVYRPPKGRITDLFASLGGLLAAIAVFIIIPLTQKLSNMGGSSYAPPPEMTVEPPEDQDFEMEQPPEETPEEPEPEEMAEESTELDLGLEVADLTGGTGGGFIMEIPKFGMKGGEDPFGGDMDTPPVPVNRLPPQYPGSLLKKGIGGKVIVTCVIDADGNVASTRIKQSSGQPELDKAALNAVSRWKFKPAKRAGKSFKATCNIPFTFEVKKS